MIEPRNLREGAIIGREVSEADPDGDAVVHIQTVSERIIDRLHWAGGMTTEEHTAATTLRNNWEYGRRVSGARAAGQSTQGSGARATKADAAWDRHLHCFHRIGGHGTVKMLEAVVLDDIKPVDYAYRKNFHGPTNFILALERLLKYFEQHSDRWDESS